MHIYKIIDLPQKELLEKNLWGSVRFLLYLYNDRQITSHITNHHHPRRYRPWKALASSTTALHSLPFWDRLLQARSPNFLRSSKASSCHLVLRHPLLLIPPGSPSLSWIPCYPVLSHLINRKWYYLNSTSS